jgi:hypothetical protein
LKEQPKRKRTENMNKNQLATTSGNIQQKRMRARSVRTIGALLLVTVVGVSACKTVPDQPDLSDLHYTPVVPPNTLYTPGTILARLPDKSADVVCFAEESVGAQLKPKDSPSADRVAQRVKNKSFGLSASYLALIRADAKYSSVKTVNYTMANVRLPTISDAMVLGAITNRTSACTNAIDGRKSLNQPLTLVTSAFIADIDYVVELSSSASLSASNRAEIMKGLALELHGEWTNSSLNVITGTRLIWGIRDNVNLVSPKRTFPITFKPLFIEPIVTKPHPSP